MAHFAKLDSNNNVLQVVVVNNVELMENGVEREEKGISFLIQLTAGHPYWKQTSYNNNFRKNYATVGGIYDPTLDAFVPPKPFPSWILNENTCQWEPPVAKPADFGTGDPPKQYRWDEVTTSWVAVE